MSIRLLALPLLIAVLLGVCPAKDELDIHTMVVGDQLLSLKEDRQLTFYADGEVTGAWLSPDGKYVAYMSCLPEDEDGREVPRVCLMRSSGGKSTVLLDGWQYRHMLEDDFEPGPETDVWIPSPEANVAWSPDGRLLAVHVEHRSIDDMDSWLWLFSASGQRRAAFELPRDFDWLNEFCWFPDSRRLAAIATIDCGEPGDTGPRWQHSVLTIDAVAGTMQTTDVQKLDAPYYLLNVKGWNSKSTAVMVAARTRKSTELWEVSIADGATRIIAEDYHALQTTSPNGMYRLDFTAEGIGIENNSTSKTESIAVGSAAEFLGWSPDSRMFSYTLQAPFSEGEKGRSKKLNSVWLSAPEARKGGRMCVVLDSDEGASLSWSRDCSKLLYIWRQQIHIAEVSSRPADAFEKLAGGIPLDEEEEKEILARNAKQIGTAIHMYNMDWDEKWPPSDGFPKNIYPYLRNEDVFLRPGTDDMVFQYYQPPDYPDPAYTDPAAIVIGRIDVGYGWMIVLYADGHVAVVPKK